MYGEAGVRKPSGAPVVIGEVDTRFDSYRFCPEAGALLGQALRNATARG